jgi:hypothetical protein
VLVTARLPSLLRAARVWKRAQATAAAIIVMTSLGIVGVASIYGPLYSLVLAPLPLPQPEQLVHVGGRVPVFNVYTNAILDPGRFDPVFAHFAVYAPVGGSPYLFGAQEPPIRRLCSARIGVEQGHLPCSIATSL